METRLKKSTVIILALLSAVFLVAAGGHKLNFASDREDPAVLSTAPVIDQHTADIQDKEVLEQDFKESKLIKKVDPIYPEEAKKAKIEGVVVVEGTTDEYGRVVRVEVLKSVPELDQAAVDAVKQWVYEPMVINGTPHGVTFTVAMNFNLDEKTDILPGKAVEEGEKAPVRAVADIRPPKLIKKVDPVYPADAKKAGIQGVVIIEATTDVHGKVAETHVLRSVKELDQAAIDAVEQWVYEPILIKGEPHGMIFTITVRFKLDDKDESGIQGGVAGGVEGGVEGGVKGGVEGGIQKGVPIRAVVTENPPGLIKKIDPVYPEEAKKAGLSGVVVLEVTTDIYGRVKNTEVKKSVAGLDQAAIDAVEQWVYEPLVIDGIPHEVVFTVTIRFNLK